MRCLRSTSPSLAVDQARKGLAAILEEASSVAVPGAIREVG